MLPRLKASVLRACVYPHTLGPCAKGSAKNTNTAPDIKAFHKLQKQLLLWIQAGQIVGYHDRMPRVKASRDLGHEVALFRFWATTSLWMRNESTPYLGLGTRL